MIPYCTQLCVWSLQISPFSTLREYQKKLSLEWGNHMSQLTSWSWRQKQMRRHPSVWADHSYAQHKPSSMQSMHAKIVLSIREKKERLTFKNHILNARAAPKQYHQQGEQEQQPMPKKKNNRNNRRQRRTKHAPAETTQLITALNTENDHMLLKPFPIKRGDPGIPIIECTIKDTTFPHTI